MCRELLRTSTKTVKFKKESEMLIFKGAEEKTIRFNGIAVVVNKGDSLDVRDFNVINDEIKPTEKHIMKKNAGLFEQTETKNTNVNSAKLVEEISDLKAENEQLKKMHESIKRSADKNVEKIAQMAEEINGFGEKESGYKNKIRALEAKIKDMQEEHEAHIARMTGGAKKK
jgi:chromosome segregation ATPase